MQRHVVGGVLGQIPGLVLVHVGVDAVGQQHDFAGGLAVFARLVQLGQRVAGAAHLGQQGAASSVKVLGQLALKPLGQETRRAAGNVHVFADQIAVHAQHEVFGVEVDVFVAGAELGGQVVAQPFGVHAQAQVLERVEARAPALAHLLAVVHGEEAVHEHAVGRLAAAEVQHGGPEQGVEGDDVLADEVVLLKQRVGHVGVVAFAALFQQVLERREVAHGRVQPHVEVLAGRVRNFDAEVGRVAADVPVAQAFAGGAVGVGADAEPFLDLVGHLGLQLAVLRPVLQKLHAARVRQLEEEVLGVFQLGLGSGEGRVGIDQVGGGVHRAAHLAVVAVLVLGVALGAFALDVAVGQEHVLLGVEELFDGAHFDQAAIGAVAQVAVDLAGQLVVFWRVGAVPVVKADVKAVQVLLAACGDVGHELLGRDACLFGGNHDGRAVRVVRAHKVHRVALHSLEPHPDVGLDVFHDVADVEVAVGIRQGGGNEEFAGR